MRIFEMMEASIAPVIVADDWLPPLGPSWEEFALFVPESEISSIYGKVKAHEGEFAHRGRLARQTWEQYFSPEIIGASYCVRFVGFRKIKDIGSYFTPEACRYLLFRSGVDSGGSAPASD
jgi:hypothetical protein